MYNNQSIKLSLLFKPLWATFIFLTLLVITRHKRNNLKLVFEKLSDEAKLSSSLLLFLENTQKEGKKCEQRVKLLRIKKMNKKSHWLQVSASILLGDNQVTLECQIDFWTKLTGRKPKKWTLRLNSLNLNLPRYQIST